MGCALETTAVTQNPQTTTVDMQVSATLTLSGQRFREGVFYPLALGKIYLFFWRGVGNRRAKGKSEGRRDAEEIKTGNEKNEGLCTKTCKNAPSRV